MLDNTQVGRHRFPRINDLMPFFSFHTTFAEKMGWILKDQGQWLIGPNLQMTYFNNQVPAYGLADYRKTTNPNKGSPLYYQITTDRKTKAEYFWLSLRVNWTLSNLNVAFRSMVKDPTRSLHIYSDVGGSSMVGNRMTDLLREIKYRREGRGRVYFEPQHIHYLPVRNQVLDIVEVQIAETVGEGEELVKFKPGHTLLTLHFKKIE